ncbi:3-mercaptopyruvate sulfurtransferase-like [Halichondria panicea]|uniref:3-mercaptopyruvate sulfurtransferase-like n=1 Tax=Halichondria panicea TaxID=6063 RepID=UPI00312B559D
MVSTLVSSLWLRQQITNGLRHIKILNASSQSDKAHQEFLEERLPNSAFFDISAISDQSSRYPDMLPRAEEFANHVMELGVSNDSHVVVYDNNEKFGLFTAPRVWWMFRAFGHPHISVLDGGLLHWKTQGYPIEQGPSDEVGKGNFEAELNGDLVRSFEQMREILAANSSQVLDARSGGRFGGTEPEPRPELPSGHMIGALNIPFKDLINEDTKLFKSKEQLQEVFQAAGVNTHEPMVSTCGSGITAGIIAMAAHIALNKNIPVYDGSWTEWVQRAPGETLFKAKEE